MGKNKKIIGIIGTGYIGLPLAVELSKFNRVIAYDKNSDRIKSLKRNIDYTHEVNPNVLKRKNILFSSKKSKLETCNIFIVTVPTPIYKTFKPDLSSLIDATKLISNFLKNGDLVIYESTVYPGCTEEICIPMLERETNLRLNKEFYVGYSPERINPGKSIYKLTNTDKIVSGSNFKAIKMIKDIYQKIIKKPLYVAENIKTAEAAKIIENTQRDLNIALMNELSIIFNKLKIDTSNVIRAASTKWNFNYYQPGLVGGHCIGVDPYYLTYKSKQLGYNPKVILAGRKINDKMGSYIGQQILRKSKIQKIKKPKALILGFTFKENCVDIRNSKVPDIANYLIKKEFKVNLHDPNLNKDILKKNKFRKVFLNSLNRKNYFDIIIIAVAHDIFKKIGIKRIKSYGKKNALIFDIKGIFPKEKNSWKL